METRAKETVVDPFSCQMVARVNWWASCPGVWAVAEAVILACTLEWLPMCRGSRTTWTTLVCVVDRFYLLNYIVIVVEEEEED